VKVAYNPIGIGEIAFFIVILGAGIFTLTEYSLLFPKESEFKPLMPGGYIALNNSFAYNNVMQENSIEVFEGAPLFYIHFPANTMHFNEKPLYLLSDASFLRDEIEGIYEGKPFEIYPFACADIPKGYAPQNNFATRSAINAEAGGVFCVRPLFGNKKEAQFGIASVSDEAITMQVISVEGG